MRGVEDISVATVTWNSGPYLDAYFSALEALTPSPQEIVIVDCASQDSTRMRLAAELQRGRLPLTIEPLDSNVGFAAGMNRALEGISGDWILSLNADALPSPSFLADLQKTASSWPEWRVGAVAARLVRAEPSTPRTLDACGMRLLRSWRHLDRGSGELDRGQFLRRCLVFGATGAASLFSRSALLDVAVEGEVFDESFFAFREDAELCFRLQERGWSVLYEPQATAAHHRHVVPQRRRSLSSEVNYHSLKNRYLLRAYHQTRSNLLRTLLPVLAREVLILGWLVSRERSSFRAFSWLWRHRRTIVARRRLIQRRRLVDSDAIDRWFFADEVPLAEGPPLGRSRCASH